MRLPGWDGRTIRPIGQIKLIPFAGVYGEMVRKIAEGEIVRILVRHKAEEKFARSYLARAAANLKNVEFVIHPTNRGWTRDSGPIFVTRNAERGTRKSESAIVHFHFNAWAKYNNWQKDRKVPETAARVLKKNCSMRDATERISWWRAAASS